MNKLFSDKKIQLFIVCGIIIILDYINKKFSLSFIIGFILGIISTKILDKINSFKVKQHINKKEKEEFIKWKLKNKK